MSDFQLQVGWYLLKTRLGDEERATANLTNMGFDIYHPKQPGKKKETISLFPGYIFLELDGAMTKDYHKIRSTQGVSQVVNFNRVALRQFNSGTLKADEYHAVMPSPIVNGQTVIDTVKLIEYRLMNNLNLVLAKGEKPQFKEGERVNFNSEVYSNFVTTFVKTASKDRGYILLNLIEYVSNAEGVVEERLIPTKEVKVPLKELRKTTA